MSPRQGAQQTTLDDFKRKQIDSMRETQAGDIGTSGQHEEEARKHDDRVSEYVILLMRPENEAEGSPLGIISLLNDSSSVSKQGSSSASAHRDGRLP